MMNATYSPEDNKLRLYSVTHLDTETYQRVRTAGFIWAPKQELFVAPMWTPARQGLLIELCGEIGDEDVSPKELSLGRHHGTQNGRCPGTLPERKYFFRFDPYISTIVVRAYQVIR